MHVGEPATVCVWMFYRPNERTHGMLQSLQLIITSKLSWVERK